jgi:Fic family protein
VTEHLIREMHEILLGREPYYVEARTAEGAPTRQLIQPGTYKKNPNQALTATGERIFFASPEETPAEMNALLAWYREQEDACLLLIP